MAFSPVAASKQIVDKYERYLNTIFNIADRRYSEGFQNALKEMIAFSSGPYLDVTDSFVKGASLQELINANLIAPKFEYINMPLDRPLYKHQQEAIEKSISGKNLVVSTGTGSGKTECFLIPILNYLIRQHEQSCLDSGVRALLVYPMNALANDQVERLRGLLSDYPEITYGSYTGQTKNRYKDALIEYKQLNNGQNPQVNELISRDQMKDSPPNILITNYAMLEYLLVRPTDSIFFERINATKWRFIVLDEAHAYNGSTGIEVSMLLRRLKAKLDNAKIQYILTSATLGGTNDNSDVAEFARNLCDSRFDENDVIRAYRSRPIANRDLQNLSFDFYSTIARQIEAEETSDAVLSAVRNLMTIEQDTGASLSEVLYDVVLHDANYSAMRSLLVMPRTISYISQTLGISQQQVADFVTVASKCECNGDKLFDARYHMFLRATESVFITLPPNGKVFLTRKKEHYEPDGISYKLFEIATCSSCHCIYFIGQEKNNILEQWSGNDDSTPTSVFLFADSFSDTDDDHTLEDENLEAEEYELCARCGFLKRRGGKITCEHDRSNFVRVYKIKIKTEGGELTKCLSCEGTSSFGILRKFFTGQEAVTSVIGTALFEALPSYKAITETHVKTDDSGFGFSDTVETRREEKEAKQFIAFSDNRQAAAFYASYLSQSYKNILYKRLIVETLKESEYDTGGRSVVNFVNDLIANFEKYNIATDTGEVTRKEAWKAILADIVDNNGNTSLCNMGLLGFLIDPKGLRANPKYDLSIEDVQNLCSVFALGMMSDAAIEYKVNLNKADKEYFTHNGVEYTYTLSDTDPKTWKRAFIPTKAHLRNKRLDYLTRVLASAGFEVEKEKATSLLESIWNFIFCSFGLVISSNGGYKLDSGKILVSRPRKWYICSKCKKITPFNVKNTCPTYQCDGKLISVEAADILATNHYYQMYQTLDIRDLRVVEHTAQLDKETAYEYQKFFKRKEIDVLSCSTTFEMGVDVGTLETVFMRNMPPSPANYAQRAGRAGRSKLSAAYALTFCTKSNHDFTFFKTPEKMIRGRIDPPKFVVENEKIAIRHLYASALSYFWKQYPTYFDDTETMLETSEDGMNGIDRFCQYLQGYPEDLKAYATRFLPDELIRKFGVDSFTWTERLLNDDPDNPGVLNVAIAEYMDEIGKLDEAIGLAGKYDRTDGLKERIRVYRNEKILEFLSRKNVMPKYGFPVDTVEMTIIDRTNKAKLGLQLQRDLSIAISEYAPGSQIIANGNLITSRYIRKVPKMSWKMYDYIRCSSCNTLNIEQHTGKEELSELHFCKQCNESFESRTRGTFIIPLFGFEADGDRIEKPGLKKPDRTFRSDIAYIGYRNTIELIRLKIGSAELELGTGSNDEMAVINENKFYICETCGYTDLDEKGFTFSKRQKHKNPTGYWCRNDGTNTLKRYSLGYRFQTDVAQIHFIKPDLIEWEIAFSVLHGVLRGACSYLNIEQSDISGCVQYFFNTETNRPNFALILYDTTPGGAGHVKRINSLVVLEAVLKETLILVEQCDCGGEQMDSSCYTCLRSYSNQKYHDILKRSYVVDLLKEILKK